MAREKLSWREKAGYALGDAASNFYWKTFEFFLFFFYTDVFRLPAATTGTMFAVARIIDGVCDPVMGIVADRTNTRWGKFRPYLLWFAVPNAAAAVLTFSTPDLEAGARVVYAYLTYTFMMIAYTAINIPYSALMGVMTPSSEERTSLSSFRFVGAFTAGLLVIFFTKRLVALLGSTPERGWQLTMLVWGAIATLMFWAAFLGTRERVRPSADQKTDLRAELRDLAGNGPWMVLFALGVIVMTNFWIRSATTVYYFKYVVGRENLFEPFAVSGTVASIFGIMLTGPLTRLAGGKKRLYMAVMVVGSVLVSLFYVVPPDRVALVFALNVATGVVMGPQAPLVWAMYADTADYSEWRTGRRATGLIFAAATFALKLGAAFAGWTTGQLLTHFGYAANEVQTAESLRGIVFLMGVVPGALGLVAAAAASFYKLDDKLMREIETDLFKRRASGRATLETPTLPPKPALARGS
jgi:GPH family glycoside/pentoside/hexuronide:cation symporter